MDIPSLLSAGLSYHQQGQLAQAGEYYKQVLQKDPNHAEALHLLGVVLYQCEQYPTSIQLIQKAIQLNASQPPYYNNLGNTYKALNQLDKAEENYKSAIKLAPTYAAAYESLGNLLSSQDKLEEALTYLKIAFKFKADHSSIFVNLGNLLQKLKRFDEARDIYLQGIQHKLSHPALYFGLAEVCRNQSDLSNALEYYQQALQLKPDYHEARFNSGHLYAQSHQFQQAINCYQYLLNSDLDQADLLYHLGNVYADACQVEKAIDYYQQALQVDPTHPGAWENYLYYLRGKPGRSNYHLFQACLKWQKTLPEVKHKPLNIRTGSNKRLKIGYLSPDFKSHSASTLFIHLFQHHHADKFEIFAYGEVHKPDKITTLFQKLSDHWRSTIHVSDEELARQIRHDKIDILVDLAGNTTHSRMNVLRYKAAPIQVCGLGFGCTTGLPEVDYRFSDPMMTPASSAQLNCEKVFYLSSLMRWIPFNFDVPLQSPPCVDNGYITFGCGNNPFKINSQVIQLWSEILNQVPHSKIHLKSSVLNYSFVQEYFLKLFNQNDISSERIIFSGSTPQSEHIQYYQNIDIALDPFPTNGGITTCEALWMGVPVISLTRGNRAGINILSQIGWPQWSHEHKKDYLQTALSMANQIDKLSQWRQTLRQKLLDSAICQGDAFCFEVEKAYQIMWKTYLRQQAK